MKDTIRRNIAFISGASLYAFMWWVAGLDIPTDRSPKTAIFIFMCLSSGLFYRWWRLYE